VLEGTDRQGEINQPTVIFHRRSFHSSPDFLTPTMKYISTRGGVDELSFEEVRELAVVSGDAVLK
jgi:hypothetical protein